MARSRTRVAREGAICREWDAWARKNNKPLTGASGSDAFSFFNYLLKERPSILPSDDKRRRGYHFQIVETCLKETGRVT